MTEVLQRLAEFRELLNRRDVAAYRLVSAAQSAIAKLNFAEIDQAQSILQGAVLDFELADAKITEFYKTQGKPAQSEKPAPNTSAHVA